MSKIPVLKAKEIIKTLKKLGFTRKRQHGSHVFFAHPDGRTTVVPYHPGKDISRGLIRKILRETNLEPDDFLNILRKK